MHKHVIECILVIEYIMEVAMETLASAKVENKIKIAMLSN